MPNRRPMEAPWISRTDPTPHQRIKEWLAGVRALPWEVEALIRIVRELRSQYSDVATEYGFCRDKFFGTDALDARILKIIEEE